MRAVVHAHFHSSLLGHHAGCHHLAHGHAGAHIHIHLQFISNLLCGRVGIDRSNFFESLRLRDIEGIKQVSYFWILLANHGSILRR